jgi:hypothetical protein
MIMVLAVTIAAAIAIGLFDRPHRQWRFWWRWWRSAFYVGLLALAVLYGLVGVGGYVLGSALHPIGQDSSALDGLAFAALGHGLLRTSFTPVGVDALEPARSLLQGAVTVTVALVDHTVEDRIWAEVDALDRPRLTELASAWLTAEVKPRPLKRSVKLTLIREAGEAGQAAQSDPDAATGTLKGTVFFMIREFRLTYQL